MHPRDGHPKLFAMIDAYLDESGIHDGAAICVIGGFFGGSKQWGQLEKEWPKVLARYGVQLHEFHAKDMLKAQRHQPMLKDLTSLIARFNKIRPVSFGVVVEDFNSLSLIQRKFLTGAIVRDRKLISTGSPNKPYFVPFQNCIKCVCEYAPIGGKAHFFFGLDKPFAGYATEMFKQTKEVPVPGSDWKTKNRLGDPAFPLAAETPQLQAADLFVHLSYLFFLERRAASAAKRKPKVSSLYRECLRNTAAMEDHGYQDRRCLEETLRRCRAKAGEKDWLLELGEGI